RKSINGLAQTTNCGQEFESLRARQSLTDFPFPSGCFDSPFCCAEGTQLTPARPRRAVPFLIEAVIIGDSWARRVRQCRSWNFFRGLSVSNRTGPARDAFMRFGFSEARPLTLAAQTRRSPDA